MFPSLLCTALTGLTSLRLVGGECGSLPPAISCLARLQSLAIDSIDLPHIPEEITALQQLTNLQLPVRPAGGGARALQLAGW